jgi:hypothetical protein
MNRLFLRGIPALLVINGVFCVSALAQAPANPSAPPDPSNTPAPPPAGLSTAILEWTPPALAQLGSQALAKESFTLDRTMLAAAIGLLPNNDDDVRQAAAKLDGVSVHVLRFAQPGTIDPDAVAAVRDAYHLRGWKHVLDKANTKISDTRSGIADVWIVLDGTNVRGAVVLFQTPKSLTLATMSGNLSPIDILHLRGHFGIPRFDGDGLGSSKFN